jgi:hypothetical protein
LPEAVALLLHFLPSVVLLFTVLAAVGVTHCLVAVVEGLLMVLVLLEQQVLAAALADHRV